MSSDDEKTSRPAGSLKAKILSGLKWEVTSHIATQACRVAMSLVLTRILAREAFGLMGMVQIFITAVELLSDIGLRGSVIHHEKGETTDFLNTVWTIKILRGCLLWVIICLGAYPFSLLYEMPELVWLLPIAGIATILRGASSTSVFLANRSLDLRWAVTIEFTALVVGNISIVVMAFISKSVVALALGWIVNQAVYSWLSFQRGMRHRICWDREAVRSIMSFGRPSLISSGVMIIEQRADRLAMGKLLSVGDLGTYVIGSNLALMPMVMFGRINAFILQPTYAKMREVPPLEARTKIRKLRFGVVLGHIPLVGALVLFGQQIVDIMYPANLQLAGWYCTLIALAGLFRVSTDPGPVFPARGDAKTHLHIILMRVFALSVSMVLGFFIGRHYGFAANGMIYGVIFSPLLSYPYEAYLYRKIQIWLPEVDFIGVLMAISLTIIHAISWQ